MSVVGSVFLAIAIVIMAWRLAVIVIRDRKYDRELVAERAASKVAALEADLFRNPREWVAEAERAVEAEQRPRGEHRELLAEREYVVALRQETVLSWMPHPFLDGLR